MSDFLFGLPTWLIVAAVLASCLLAFTVWALFTAADLGAMYDHADRVDQKMRDLNHQDVADRVESRDFQSWDADDDLPA